MSDGSVPSAPSVPGFESLTEIGRGGYGVVYRAWEPALQRQVAIKMMWANLDASARERFTREGRAMSALAGHPNVLAVHQVGVTEENHPYLVMPYLERGSLAQQLRATDDQPMRWEEATRLTVRLAGALATAHATGILHRDIKPANVLLSDYGEPELADFGIARMSGGFETTAGGITASVLHAAPEVLNQQPATVASDLYSLGSTFFALLHGEPAFLPTANDEMVAVYIRVLREPIPDLRAEGVPDAICRVVEQSMAKDPASRQQSAAELGEQLRSAQRLLGADQTDMAVTARGPAPALPPSGAPVTAPAGIDPADTVASSLHAPEPASTAKSSRGRIGLVIALGVLVVLFVAGAIAVGRSTTSSSGPSTVASSGSPATGPSAGSPGPGSSTPVSVTLGSTPVSIPMPIAAGQSGEVTVNGTAGQGLIGSVRFDPEPATPVRVELRFNESVLAEQMSDGATVNIPPVVLPNRGSYGLIVGPSPTATKATVELVQAVDPIELSTTIGGPPTPIELVQSYQTATLAFDGRAGQQIQGQWRWGGQRGIYTTVQILDTDENELGSWSVLEGDGRGPVVTLPADGRYRMRVSIDGDATGRGEASVHAA